jgi:hypothetical protein
MRALLRARFNMCALYKVFEYASILGWCLLCAGI